MIRKVFGFFERLFTSKKFPTRKTGKMDKKVEDVYNVKIMNSKEDNKKVVVLDPRDTMEKEK